MYGFSLGVHGLDFVPVRVVHYNFDPIIFGGGGRLVSS